MLCVDGVDKESNTNEDCCDENAECSCDTNSGHYKCLCKPGYFGSGLINSCHGTQISYKVSNSIQSSCFFVHSLFKWDLLRYVE